MEVRIYSEVHPLLNSLDPQTYAKVFRAFDMLKLCGHELRMPHSRHRIGRIFELRVRGKLEVRLFYFFRPEAAMIIHGFIKKTFRTPLKEIDLAVQRVKAFDNI